MSRSSRRGKRSKKGGRSRGEDSRRPSKGARRPGSGRSGSRPRQDEAGWRGRFTPVRTPTPEATGTGEVTASRAFITSFILFSLMLAPVIGIGVYFARSTDFVKEVFPDKEAAFVGGMTIGVVIAFVVSVLFTRRAVAQS